MILKFESWRKIHFGGFPQIFGWTLHPSLQYTRKNVAIVICSQKKNFRIASHFRKHSIKFGWKLKNKNYFNSTLAITFNIM